MKPIWKDSFLVERGYVKNYESYFKGVQGSDKFKIFKFGAVRVSKAP